MDRFIIFGVLSLPVIFLSRRTLFNLKSHGFYRLFSWESIIWLLINDYSFWFDHPLVIRQIFSWIFLFVSIYFVTAGTKRLKKAGKPASNRDASELYNFEKTTELVDSGIFKFIRHPLYSSLLFLTWGIFLKNPTFSLLPVALLSSAFLFATALADEKECIQYFGYPYKEYMNRSKRFIPFVL